MHFNFSLHLMFSLGLFLGNLIPMGRNESLTTRVVVAIFAFIIYWTLVGFLYLFSRIVE
jgi:hypothetical protein